MRAAETGSRRQPGSSSHFCFLIILTAALKEVEEIPTLVLLEPTRSLAVERITLPEPSAWSRCGLSGAQRPSLSGEPRSWLLRSGRCYSGHPGLLQGGHPPNGAWRSHSPHGSRSREEAKRVCKHLHVHRSLISWRWEFLAQK